MLNSDQFIKIGQVLKSNGTDGQVVISLTAVSPADISNQEPVFIFFDELPVPYFISDAITRGSNKILAYLTDCTCLEDAEELSGRSIYMRDEDFDGEEDLDFTGWTLIPENQNGQEAARQFMVSGIEDIPGNPCLIVENGAEEILVPLHEDLITEIDQEKKTLRMNLPEGLL